MNTADALRVLVVDDCHDAADSLVMLLRLWGLEPVVAYSGPVALDLVTACTPHVALLDLALPTMSGFSVARRLRARPELASLVLVAVTGHADEVTYGNAVAAGIEHVLVKPVDPEALRSLLVQVGAQVLVKTTPPTKKTKPLRRIRDASQQATSPSPLTPR
jgi:CheY-like chemotaxis protein